VQADSTIIIIYSGNFEYVCVRCRETQTLYISDLIDVPHCTNPRYGKLHTGIYIAAIQDAMQRVTEMSPVHQSYDIGDVSEENGNFMQDERRHEDRKDRSGKGKDRERDDEAGPSGSRNVVGEMSDNLQVDQVCQRDLGQGEDTTLFKVHLPSPTGISDNNLGI
jgi:hypothetical protein